jgi:hypothetical protein
MGRGLSASNQALMAKIIRVLTDEHPSGVRRVAYALFGNQASQWTKPIGQLVKRARREGLIPWDWIDDATRPEILPNVCEDLHDVRAINRTVPAFDPWLSQSRRVVVWSEKSVGGTVEPVLSALLVPFQIHHGHTSETVLHDVAEATLFDRRRLVIVWIGDHDASGLDMGRDITQRLVELGLPRERFIFQRVAITRDDVFALWKHRNPVKQTTIAKKGDPRTPAYIKATGLHCGVELEAMNSNVLRERVEVAVRSHITDVGAWDQVMHTSEIVQQSWSAYADQWQPPSISTLGSE